MPAEVRLLRPLLLLFPARSGSTLLMQLLGTSPKVVFDRAYPFEFRYLSHLLRWATQLADANNRHREWTTEQLVAEEPKPGNRVEPPPFAMPRGFAIDSASPLWKSAFHAAWREFSRRSIRSSLCSPELDPAPVYYAEKTRSLFHYTLQELGVAHDVVYLLRDPRDILMSMFGFNKKSGENHFAIKDGESPDDVALRFIDDRRRRLRMLLELVPNDPTSTIVRYEEMILDLPTVAARLSQRFGLQLDAHAVQAKQGEFKDHMSSRGPKASLGRWRREMPQSVQQLFAQHLGTELTALGYEV